MKDEHGPTPAALFTKVPPYLTVLDSPDGPMLLLTVELDSLNVCDRCPHLHVRVLDAVATPDAIRRFAASLRHWAARLERAS